MGSLSALGPRHPGKGGQAAHATWGADAFAIWKSMLRTCQKNGRNFLDYGLSLVQAHAPGSGLPLPLDSSQRPTTAPLCRLPLPLLASHRLPCA